VNILRLPDGLKPGDALLYSSEDPVDWVFEHVTGGPVAHIEGYLGDNESVASRNGRGVGKYALRMDGLAAVLRPNQAFNFTNAMTWFETVNGDDYDWQDLLPDFFTDGLQVTANRLFCSAFMTLWYAEGGFAAISPNWPANKVDPVDFLKTPALEHILETFKL
jgi:hypothetical protein